MPKRWCPAHANMLEKGQISHLAKALPSTPIPFRQVLNIFRGKFFWALGNVEIELTEIGLMSTSDEFSQKELCRC